MWPSIRWAYVGLWGREVQSHRSLLCAPSHSRGQQPPRHQFIRVTTLRLTPPCSTANSLPSSHAHADRIQAASLLLHSASDTGAKHNTPKCYASLWRPLCPWLGTKFLHGGCPSGGCPNPYAMRPPSHTNDPTPLTPHRLEPISALSALLHGSLSFQRLMQSSPP